MDFWGFYLFSQKFLPKTLKFMSFLMFRPHSFWDIAPPLICCCTTNGCKTANDLSFKATFFAIFIVVKCCSSGVPRSIRTYYFAGLWSTETYSTSLGRSNIYWQTFKSSRVSWGVLVTSWHLKITLLYIINWPMSGFICSSLYKY